MDIVSDVRTGDISTSTIRKVLKQLDSALAKFGLPDRNIIMGSVDEESLDYICSELKSLVDNDSEKAQVGNLTMDSGNRVYMLLKALLDLLLA